MKAIVQMHRNSHAARRMSALTVAILGSTCLSPVAFAAAAAQTAQAPAVEEIVVTGSRVVRDGYEAPTPVSVVGIEQLQTTATSNLADAVNSLPVLSGSATPQTSVVNTTSGLSAINGLSLRGLGNDRTLTLLNGQRTVGSILTGSVDISELPQSLISRVDVVTGGASAAYGSDALAGVVNFVLDTNFTGVKGEISGGVTTYGDARNWKVNLTGGTGFANDRGHFLFSGEAVKDDGKLIADRPWDKLGYYYINNPTYTATNGQPRVLAAYNVATSVSSWGGTITSGPLRGTSFGPGGAQYQTVFGSIVSDPLMSGGSWATNQVASVRGGGMQPIQDMQNVFMRASYDIDDDTQVYGQAAWGHLYSFSTGAPNFNPGNLVISSSNAFIPANLAATLQAAGPTVTMGTFNMDQDSFHSVNERRVLRFLVGASGKVNAFDTLWKWDGYLSIGNTIGTLKSIGARDQTRWALAIDAVRNANGAIVCRSTLTDPTNGCVPYNPFGIGVNSTAAINYLQGRYGWNNQRLNQKVAAITATGEPFSTWAGAVSIATGIEHREEKMRQVTDPEEQANPAIWFQGAGLPYSGKFTVTEGFVEAVIPLAKDTVWAKAFDLNGAVRATGYSTFGYTTTWKVGANWQLTDDIRFRATQSRNIREPNLVDLYKTGSTSQSSINDPANNNAVTNNINTATGNPNLQPERSDDTGLGVVYQPGWFPGFNMSFDYYNIDISGAVNSLGTTQLITLCLQGNQAACSTFTRTGSGASAVIISTSAPGNFATESEKGFDIEASYVLPLATINDSWDGKLSTRFLATHFISYMVFSGAPGTFPIEYAGVNSGKQNGGSGVPSWRYQGVVNYALDPVNVGLTFRGISAGVINPTYIECTSGCPASTADHTTVSSNNMDGAFYVDLNLSYKIPMGDSAAYSELFFNVRNLANADPALMAIGPGGSNYDFYPANSGQYDIMGRVFRAGIRFKM
ncbi:MAG: TonB-dependent receptor domain-containing protein [Rhodospirillaceae bacterium]